MHIKRRSFLITAGASLALSPFNGSARAVAGFVEAGTPYGRLRGERSKGICRFLGVPYAGSVSAMGRFKAPPPLAPWSGIRDALVPGAPSIQPPSPILSGSIPPIPSPSEDCLNLNIWTPAADGRRRPVMFYNHGGAFIWGSCSTPSQDGSRLAREHDVVVVASNHRLGLLGYLFLPDILGPEYSGNPGLLDIAAALRWTHENIHAFGGDPDNIMVFGESGGGAKTSCIFAMPEVKDLFHKASIESIGSAGARMKERENANATTRAVLKYLGITESNARKLHEMPAAELLKAQLSLSLLDFWPVVDGTSLPSHPFDPVAPQFSARKPLICGTCRDETVLFSRDDPSAFSLDEAGLRERLVDTLGADMADQAIAVYRMTRPTGSPSDLFFAITTAQLMVRGEIVIAEHQLARHSAPVYMYQLVYPSAEKWPWTDYPMGSPHASDIFMKFNTPDIVSAADPMLSIDQTPGRFKTAANMSTMWATFARTNQPGAPGQPTWPGYTVAERGTMLIDTQCRVVNDPDREERLFWEKACPSGCDFRLPSRKRTG
jgi:para-nitrobenzyl esterase